jgi:hypothetical protein
LRERRELSGEQEQHEMTDLFENDLVHVLLLSGTLVLALDAEEVLLERNRSEGRVEVEEALVTRDSAGNGR